MILWLLCTQYPLDGLSLRIDILHDFPVYPAGHWQCRKLVGSSLKKMICGNYTPSFLLSSTGSVLYELRRQFVVVNNLSQMYAMLGTGQWAIESDTESLLYMTATAYPTTVTGPQVHLVRESILPTCVAFGMQKDSQLKP